MKNNKLKKVENLKLRTSTFGLKNKLGIIAIVCLLIFAAGVDATIKLGNDDTTDWSMVDSDKIRTSNGKSFPATGTGLQDAIWDLNETGGTVWLPTGNISHTGIHVLGNNLNSFSLIGDNTTLYNTGSGVSLILNSSGADSGEVRNTLIANIEFEGTSSSGHGIEVLSHVNIVRLHFKDLYIHNHGGCGIKWDGISGGYGVYYSSIENCQVDDNDEYGFYSLNGTNNLNTIQLSRFNRNGYDGVYLNSGNTWSIFCSDASNNGCSGFNISATGTTLIASYTEGNTEGIYLSVVNCVIILGTNIDGCNFTSEPTLIHGNEINTDYIQTRAGTNNHLNIRANGTGNVHICKTNGYGVDVEFFHSRTDNGVVYIFNNGKYGSMRIDGLDNFEIASPAGENLDLEGGWDIELTAGHHVIPNNFVLPTSIPNNPISGSVYFNATTNILNIYNGTAWVSTTLT